MPKLGSDVIARVHFKVRLSSATADVASSAVWPPATANLFRAAAPKIIAGHGIARLDEASPHGNASIAATDDGDAGSLMVGVALMRYVSGT
jgi:hypothetical protein